MNTNILHIPDRLTVWQCIGCGKIEGPQPCIGVCEDHKVELLYASVYDEAIKQVAIIQRRSDALESIVRFIAHTTPHEGKWEASYRALQDQARQTLIAIGVETKEA